MRSGVPRDARRLERIFHLIQRCGFSVHDISRIQLDRRPPRAPRFNMPFELGLAVAWTTLNQTSHFWVGCDVVPHRPLKSINDLNGTDFHIHHGTVRGVLSALCNAFVSRRQRPTMPRRLRVYRRLRGRFRHCRPKPEPRICFRRVCSMICSWLAGVCGSKEERVQGNVDRPITGPVPVGPWTIRAIYFPAWLISASRSSEVLGSLNCASPWILFRKNSA
jgi:hypothetical protein